MWITSPCMKYKYSIVFWMLYMAAIGCKNVKKPDQQAADASNTGVIISNDPNTPDSLRELSVEKLVEQRQYNNAINQINLLLQKDSLNPAWLFMKADAIEKSGDTVQAILFYEKAIQSAGKFTEASARLANLFAEKANAQALAICDLLLKDPTAASLRSDVLFIEAIYYIRAGQKINSMRIFDQIIKEDYTYLDAYLEKGILLFDQKNFTEARKVFEKSTIVKNSFADGYYWMARCDERLNNKTEAADNYKRSIALDTGFTEAREALARLQSN